MYRITYANGDRPTDYDTYEEAVTSIHDEWPYAVVGHDGDLESGGDCTLCWSCEEDSVDDDGARAVASIYRVLPSVGDFVCLGDYEGMVVSLDNSMALVDWCSGVRSKVLISDLTVI